MKTFEEMLAEWQGITRDLAVLKRREGELRKALFAGAFPNPHEGTQKITLADGRELAGKLPYNRKIDEAHLEDARAELITFNQPEAALVFGSKPTLSVAHYKKLDAAATKVADRAIICAPGTPTLEVR